MWDRAKQFLTRAGTVILGISIVLWFLATYPKSSKIDTQFEAQRTEITNSFNTISLTTGAGGAATQSAALQDQIDVVNKEEAGEKLRHSFAGMMGRAIEPIIAPLGFDWKIGIGLVASFAAREVFVSTMSTVYNVGEVSDSAEGMQTLEQTLREQRRTDGGLVYTTLTAVTLMVFYVFAMQCVSTVVVVRRETNSWKWPFFQWLYMGVLAWVLAFITYHGGKMLGWD
jgi:ferrous iron transport protein B